MTIKQEMVSILFKKETIEKVKCLFADDQEVVPIDSEIMNFRLLNT